MSRTPLVHILILVAFLANTFGPMPAHGSTELTTSTQEEFRLPAPGVMVHLSPEFNPPILKGIKVHPDNPFRFDFILDKGDSPAGHEQLKDESAKLIKYFLASLTIPEKDLWVNLSPYEKDRIIPNSFGLTEMGRDLLAEDYLLKQITASLIYPEDEIGKKFWKRVYEEAAKKYGTTNIPVNTFNKVWIVPEKAVVYENAKAGTAYVVESRLKVMLEEDYLALSKNSPPLVGGARGGGNISNTPPPNLPHEGGGISTLGSQIVREIVIPELTKEVNENKNFAQLRQVYNSLILATWYKKKIKDSILAQVYADKNKVVGVGYANSVIASEAKQSFKAQEIASSPTAPRNDTEIIYQRYLAAFKRGVYNYIKEDIDPVSQETIPRKYFSGGVTWADIKIEYADGAMITSVLERAPGLIHVETSIMPEGLGRPTQILPADDFSIKKGGQSESEGRKKLDAFAEELLKQGKKESPETSVQLGKKFGLKDSIVRNVLSTKYGIKIGAIKEETKQFRLWAEPRRGTKVSETQEELATKFGLSQRRISGLLSKYDIATPGKKSEETKQFRLWAEPRRRTKVPETRPELAAKFGLSEGWIAQLLSEYDITTSGNENESEGTKQFRQWAEPRRGTKIPEIQAVLATKFGLSKSRIAQLLSEYDITTPGNGFSEGTKQFRQWAEPRRGTKVPETRPELAAKFGLSQGWIAQLLLEYKIETKTVWSTKVIKVKDTRPVLTSEERLRQDLGWETKILKEQAQEYWKEHRFAELSSGLTYVIAEEVSKMRDYYSQLMFNESVSAGGIVLKEVLDSYDPQKDGNSLIDYFRRQLKTRIPEILIFPRKSGHFKELVMEKDNSHNLRTISIGSENRLPFGQASGILISEPI